MNGSAGGSGSCGARSHVDGPSMPFSPAPVSMNLPESRHHGRFRPYISPCSPGVCSVEPDICMPVGRRLDGSLCAWGEESMEVDSDQKKWAVRFVRADSKSNLNPAWWFYEGHDVRYERDEHVLLWQMLRMQNEGGFKHHFSVGDWRADAEFILSSLQGVLKDSCTWQPPGTYMQPIASGRDRVWAFMHPWMKVRKHTPEQQPHAAGPHGRVVGIEEETIMQCMEYSSAKVRITNHMSCTPGGYLQVCLGTKKEERVFVRAHQLVMWAIAGPPQAGDSACGSENDEGPLEVAHSCNNKMCLNFSHLFYVSHKKNCSKLNEYGEGGWVGDSVAGKKVDSRCVGHALVGGIVGKVLDFEKL